MLKAGDMVYRLYNPRSSSVYVLLEKLDREDDGQITSFWKVLDSTTGMVLELNALMVEAYYESIQEII